MNKKENALVPKKIAVVTSLTAAALQDIIHIAERPPVQYRSLSRAGAGYGGSTNYMQSTFGG